MLGNSEGWTKEFSPKPLERGVATHIYASFDPSLKRGFPHVPQEESRANLDFYVTANNGAYLIDSHVADPLRDTVKPWATSSLEAERLWKLSESLVGEAFPY